MMRPAAFIFVALLSGCTTTYQNTLQSGYKYDFESTRRPPEVASCITSRVESQRPWRVVQRPLGDRGAIELVIGSGAQGVAAVAHISPSPYGSRIDTWITSHAVITRDIWHEQFFGGC